MSCTSRLFFKQLHLLFWQLFLHFKRSCFYWDSVAAVFIVTSFFWNILYFPEVMVCYLKLVSCRQFLKDLDAVSSWYSSFSFFCFTVEANVSWCSMPFVYIWNSYQNVLSNTNIRNLLAWHLHHFISLPFLGYAWCFTCLWFF